MAVEGDELRTQLANLLNEVAYQLGFGALAYVGRAERLHAPALGLAARDQSADANDFVERMFGKPWPDRFAYVGVGRVAQVEHTAAAARSGTGLQVPNDN